MLFKRREKTQPLDPARLPAHVAIIMDGNGRWAQRRGLPRSAGHRAGVEAIREVIRMSDDLGIAVLSLYAFSTENWKRPAEEVGLLMDLLVEFFSREIDELDRKNVRIRFMGDITALPEKPRASVEEAMTRTRDNTGLILNIALNYGGRAELVMAVKAMMADVARGALKPEAVDEEVLSGYLYSRGLPDPDLIIRTSGEMRLSNFMLYQASYAEWVVTDTLWPDFNRAEYTKALLAYQGRKRRFGDVGK